MKQLLTWGAFLALLCVSTGLGQTPQWFEIIEVPVKSGSARVHMAQMRKALPRLLAGEAVPTNGVPLVAQVQYQYDPWILPETLVSSSDFRSWLAVEVPKRTTDPVLKPVADQKGNSVGAILSYEGDGTRLPVKSLVVQAQIWDPLINDYLVIKPSKVLLEGLVYPKDREGSFRTDEKGNLLKPYKYVFGSLGSLKKSRLKIDAFNLFVQFDSALGIDASSVPGSTNEEKLSNATKIVADNLGEVHVYAGFISHPGTEDEEILFEDFTFFWLLPPE